MVRGDIGRRNAFLIAGSSCFRLVAVNNPRVRPVPSVLMKVKLGDLGITFQAVA